MTLEFYIEYLTTKKYQTTMKFFTSSSFLSGKKKNQIVKKGLFYTDIVYTLLKHMLIIIEI
jgi:hypothetical protein